MGISLISNIPALAIRPHLESASRRYSQATARLASGKRILHPSDDAAGLSRASLVESRLRGTEQAQRNTSQAQSLIQVAEGGIEETSNIINRLRELSMQGASNYLTDAERGLIEIEMRQLTEEVDRLSESVRFAGQPLLNGRGAQYTFQVGTESTDSDKVTFDASGLDMHASALGISSLSISDTDAAASSLATLDAAQQKVLEARSTLGAIQSRLQPVQNQLKSQEESLTLVLSNIMDADVVNESLNLASSQIIQQSSIAMLAQTNKLPQLALRLIELLN